MARIRNSVTHVDHELTCFTIFIDIHVRELDHQVLIDRSFSNGCHSISLEKTALQIHFANDKWISRHIAIWIHWTDVANP